LKRRALDDTVEWSTRSDDVRIGKIKIKTWLEILDKQEKDIFSVMDKLVWDNQIGKLGDRIETNLYSPEEKLPIFEMRDIESECLAGILQSLERLKRGLKNTTTAHQALPNASSRERYANYRRTRLARETMHLILRVNVKTAAKAKSRMQATRLAFGKTLAAWRMKYPRKTIM
jgi:hypothetical protein